MIVDLPAFSSLKRVIPCKRKPRISNVSGVFFLPGTWSRQVETGKDCS
jgi:hypothetical protein